MTSLLGSACNIPSSARLGLWKSSLDISLIHINRMGIRFCSLLNFLVPNFGKSALIWREIQTTWSALCFCLFFDDSQFLSHSTCERVIFLISPERSYWSQLCSPKKNRYGRGSRWVLVSVVGPIFSLWTSGIYHYYDSRPKKELYTSPKRLE